MSEILLNPFKTVMKRPEVVITVSGYDRRRSQGRCHSSDKPNIFSMGFQAQEDDWCNQCLLFIS